MISFDNYNLLLAFLEKNMSPKIQQELFFEWTTWEHKGKTVGRWNKLNPRSIINTLEKDGFVYGISENEYNPYPTRHILLWTKMKKSIDDTDSLPVEFDKYALISINKACQFLDVSRPTLYKLLSAEKIPYVEILSQRRIQLKDLLDYIDKNKRKV